MTTRRRQAAAGSHTTRRRSRRTLTIAVASVVLIGLAVLGLQYAATDGTPAAYALAPESVLTPRIRQAPPRIRENYRFAVANRDTLSKFPCFCGCFLEAGHRNNAACYIRDVKPDGTVEFDLMSLG